MTSHSYQRSHQWLKHNLNAPLTTVIYVASVAFIVKIRNFFSDNEYRVLVEVYTSDEESVQAKFFLPRICIFEYSTFESKVTKMIENVITPG